ncbi:MAG TPA: DUF4279 domain-containing protein [Steroidobacteraceae bacterium]|nr:DUF4279 domain-containing protein [Steroidobacteraceae bacterium]
MSEYEFTVSLRIRHPTIDPATISAVLGIQPQHAWRAGEMRCDPSGAELGGAHHDSYWISRLMDEPQLSSDGVSVERVILQTLSQLRRSRAFLEQLNAEGGVAELLVSLYARNDFRLELPPDSLTLLGRMHLAVVLDVHPHSPLKAPVSRPN